MRILAAVFGGRTLSPSVEEVELSEPRADEVLVRLHSSGICHADLLARDGDLPFPLPGVLGHEGAGDVLEVGSDVDSVDVGDHVILSMPCCGKCRACRSGQPRYCVHVLELISGGGRLDGSSSLQTVDGTPLHSHFFGQSSFATHCVVRANQAVRVASDVRLDELGHIGCGVMTGAGAIFNTLQPPPGSSLAVFGVGTVGLAAVMAARCTGAVRIVAIDRNADRLRMASSLGATEVIHALPGADLQGLVREACDGVAERALECTGDIGVVRAAIDSVGMRGICGLVGGAPAGAQVTFDHHSTLIGKRIVGIHGGEGRSDDLIETILSLQRQGRFPVHLLSKGFRLSDIGDALLAASEGHVIKPVIRMVGDLP